MSDQNSLLHDSFLSKILSRQIDSREAAAFFKRQSTADKAILLQRLEALSSKGKAPLQDSSVLPPERARATPRTPLATTTNANCSQAQKQFLAEFMREFEAKTKCSKALATRYRDTFADQRTPANFNLLLKEIHYPLTYEKAVGSSIHDVDGNRYIDITSDFGVNLFGHQPAFLVDALSAQLSKGIALSGRYDAIGESSDLFCELTGHERVSFCQSGTESLMTALRIARAFTGRAKIAIFAGAYHGHSDVFLDEHIPGVSEASSRDMLVLSYGDDSSLDQIASCAGELAAIVVEPVQSEQLALQPVEFLRKLRALTSEHGILLIFDEMITGFRVHPRGCQGYFGVAADLATYGKVLGGGITAGAVGGREDVMRWVDGGSWRYGDQSKPSSTTYVAGTHTQNPLKMAATLAILRELKARSPLLQDRLNEHTAAMVREINAYLGQEDVPVEVLHFGSQFRFRFHARQFTLTQALFLLLLNHHGVRYAFHGNCFLTDAHSEQDRREIVAAVKTTVRTLVRNGFFHESNARERGTGESGREAPDDDLLAGGHAATRGRVVAVSRQTEPPKAVAPSMYRTVDRARVVMDVKTIVGDFLELSPDKFDEQVDLAELGVDSIMFMGIIKATSKRFGTKLSTAKMANIHTTGEIAALLLSDYAAALAAHYGTAEASAAGLPTTAVDVTQPAPAAPAMTASSTAMHERAVSRDVAIIGMSALFPDAPNLDAFWRNLVSRRSSIREVPAERWDWRSVYSISGEPGKTNSKWGAFIDGFDRFDPLFFRISPKEARFMDPQARIVLQETYRALEDAGLSVPELTGSRTGVFIGYEFSEYRDYLARVATTPEDGQALAMFAGTNEPYYLANRVSFTFDFRGPSEAINVNCASSAVSINRACQSLLTNESTLAIAGGICLRILPEGYVHAKTLLSPDGTCRVFDEHANGFTRGEGCGVLVLKRLEDAQRDGDAVYAVIKGCEQNNRGFGRSLSDIRPGPLTDVIKRCYQRASIDPKSIRYIEVDGYGTKWGDALEFEAIKDALDKQGATTQFAKSCGLGSLKGNIGNLEPASGVASVIKVALALANKCFPPTHSVETVNEFIDVDDDDHPLFLVREEVAFDELRCTDGTPIRAGVNCFADSGVNLHILLEEAADAAAIGRSAPEPGPFVFVVSARTAEALSQYLDVWRNYLRTQSGVDLARLAYSVQTGRAAMKHRFACVVSTRDELVRSLEAAGENAPMPNCHTGVVERTAPETNCAEETQSLIHAHRLDELARLWVTGALVRWRDLYGQNPPMRLHQLPAYVFGDKRYWVDAATAKTASPRPSTARIEATTADAGILPEERMPVTGAPREPEPATAADGFSLRSTVIRIARAVLELDVEEEIDELANFSELGFSSISIVSFIDRLNEVFALTLPETTAFDYTNLNELSKHLAGQVASDGSEHGIAPLRAGHLPARPARTVKRELRDKIKAVLALDDDDEISDTMNFSEIGLTSISIIDFIDALNADFGLELPETTPFDYTNIDELSSHIEALLRRGSAPCEPTDSSPNAQSAKPGHDQDEPSGEINIDALLIDLESKRINVEQALLMMQR